MKTLTLLKKAEQVLQEMKDSTCQDFHTYEILTDWDSLNKTLTSIKNGINAYEKNHVTQKAKLTNR